MRTPIRPKLKDLQIGDKFHHANSKNGKPVFEVTGRLKFNIGFGSVSRECKNLDSGKTGPKSGRLEVVKHFYCLECKTRIPSGKYCNECEIL